MTFVLKTSEYDVVGLINSCDEMVQALKSDFGQDCIEFHLRSDLNDFAHWAEKELKNEKLGNELRKVTKDYVDMVLLKKVIRVFEKFCRDSKRH